MHAIGSYSIELINCAVDISSCITIKASKNARFKAGKDLKDALNKGK